MFNELLETTGFSPTVAVVAVFASIIALITISIVVIKTGDWLFDRFILPKLIKFFRKPSIKQSNRANTEEELFKVALNYRIPDENLKELNKRIFSTSHTRKAKPVDQNDTSQSFDKGNIHET